MERRVSGSEVLDSFGELAKSVLIAGLILGVFVLPEWIGYGFAAFAILRLIRSIIKLIEWIAVR